MLLQRDNTREVDMQDRRDGKDRRHKDKQGRQLKTQVTQVITQSIKCTPIKIRKI